MQSIDDDDDLERIVARDLPDPYCLGAWRHKLAGLTALATVVAGVALAGYGGASPVSAAGMVAAIPAQPAARPVAFARAVDPVASGGRPRSAFNAAAEAIRPSVMGIRAVGGATAGHPGFERIGSGIVVQPGGLVLTCNHVIAGASRVSASRFRHPNERIPLEVVATEGDLALLRMVGGPPVPPATFGDPSRLGVGDWVLAVGHPFGLGLSVSAGIVGRRNAEITLPGGQRQQGLLQTDAPINEGSSGGPLVNTNGEVVGVNMAILAPDGVFTGAGFAIDANRARSFVERNRRGPNPAPVALVQPAPPIRRAALGLGLTDLNPSLAASARFPATGGALVTSVVLNSPADRAQFARGDVITAIGERPITSVAAVGQALSGLGSTGMLPIQIWRHGRAQTLVIQMAPSFAEPGRG